MISTATTISSIFIKVLKLINNAIILILYSMGDNGDFLGVGGVWNLNEEKSADSEIVASGVIVGFLIYTTCSTLGYFFGTTKHNSALTDTIMNVVGTIMWLAVGGTALHHWRGYLSNNDFLHVASDRQIGIALGALCVIEGAFYLVDTILACIHFSNGEKYEDE